MHLAKLLAFRILALFMTTVSESICECVYHNFLLNFQEVVAQLCAGEKYILEIVHKPPGKYCPDAVALILTNQKKNNIQ